MFAKVLRGAHDGLDSDSTRPDLERLETRTHSRTHALRYRECILANSILYIVPHRMKDSKKVIIVRKTKKKRKPEKLEKNNLNKPNE